MTPGARVSAAIEVLDRVFAGGRAEKELTNWARRSRFAGSKDRAAVRDHVYSALRRLRSVAAAGGGDPDKPTGRAALLGLLRLDDVDPNSLFTGEGHAPQPLSAAERQSGALEGICNLQNWFAKHCKSALGEDRALAYARSLEQRAPITLRANLLWGARESLQKELLQEGFETLENPLAGTALTLRGDARGLSATRLFHDGAFEMQDAASQAVVASLPRGKRILDYCAGGGGKALALAARDPSSRIVAHDADAKRLTALKKRAMRAGADISLCYNADALKGQVFDIVLLDVPCSGSGSWRRDPEGKWTLTKARLARLSQTQREIIEKAKEFVARDGILAYATCSVLPKENEGRVAAFLEVNASWTCISQQQWWPDSHGDGFYLAMLTKGTQHHHG